jgi:hypothetical protein
MWYNILAGGVYAETLQAENIILSAYPTHILRHQYMGGIFYTKGARNGLRKRNKKQIDHERGISALWV